MAPEMSLSGPLSLDLSAVMLLPPLWGPSWGEGGGLALGSPVQGQLSTEGCGCYPLTTKQRGQEEAGPSLPSPLAQLFPPTVIVQGGAKDA